MDRQAILTDWVAEQLRSLNVVVDSEVVTLAMVSGDASFRRYFRAQINGRSVIAVDAPPEKEDSRPFVAIAQAWLECGVHVPEVLAADFEQGFMLLSDLGDTLYLGELNGDTANELYGSALTELIKIQGCSAPQAYDLPIYDSGRLLTEMRLCPDWFLSQLLGVSLSDGEEQMLQQVFLHLIDSALEQPQVCVHRDYHSRNLMKLADGDVGVLDFQDAVHGPITYDLVSLIRDCYISWSPEREQQWISQFQQLAEQAGLLGEVEIDQFKRWFDWMGMQRHIKCVGIFSRLYLRDGKPGYLNDIPRTFAYLKHVSERYPEFSEFNAWLEAKVIPAMQANEKLPTDTAVRVMA